MTINVWKSSVFALALRFKPVSYTHLNKLSVITFKDLSSPSKTSPSLNDNFSHLYKDWLKRFRDNNIPDPEISLNHIVEYILNPDFNKEKFGYKRISVVVTEEHIEKINNLCECRLARMPVQYIIKEWDFRELHLTMCPPVFIPRPETEQLVDLLLDSVPVDFSGTALEVGCGSGAICLSLVKARPKAFVIAVDQSKLACDLTLKNARLNINDLTDNLRVVQSKLKEDGSLSESLPLETGEVDVIVSNPPYVPTADILDLQPEIKLYEDLRALEAGKDGLRVICSLLILSKSLLRAGGQIFLEVNSSHPALVEKWLQKHPELHLRLVRTVRDYCDRDRFLVLDKLTF